MVLKSSPQKGFNAFHDKFIKKPMVEGSIGFRDNLVFFIYPNSIRPNNFLNMQVFTHRQALSQRTLFAVNCNEVRGFHQQKVLQISDS